MLLGTIWCINFGNRTKIDLSRFFLHRNMGSFTIITPKFLDQDIVMPKFTESLFFIPIKFIYTKMFVIV